MLILLGASFASADDLIPVIVYYKDVQPDAVKGMRVAHVRAPPQTVSALQINDQIQSRRDFKSVPGFTAMVTADAYRELMDDPDVEVHRSGTFHILLSDSVPQINADEVWALQESGQDITGAGYSVCVIDTGVQDDHPDLAGKVIAQKCYCSDDCCQGNNESVNASDDNGHGTHVAGIIAADGNLKGVAPGASIVAVKVMDSSGIGEGTDIALGIDWCVSNIDLYNITVISMSLGDDCAPNLGLFDYNIDAAHAANISLVAAAGNIDAFDNCDASSMTYPACAENVVSVGSVDEDNLISSFTCRDISLDLFAPGRIINSTYLTNNYQEMNGTSMSAPHVSAALALMSQYYGLKYGMALTPDEKEDILKNTGVPVFDSANSMSFPRIDVLAAVAYYQPIVSLVSPDGIPLAQDNISLFFNISDSDSDYVNCSLYINGTLNETLEFFPGPNNFVFDGADGYYSWNISCTDEYNDTGYSGTFEFGKDTSIPVVFDLEVFPSSWTNSPLFTFTWEATDMSNISRYYYKFYEAPTSDTDGSMTYMKNLTHNESTAGNHSFYVWAEDILGNIDYNAAVSIIYYFDDVLPDIFLDALGTSYNAPISTSTANITYNVTDLSPEKIWYEFNGRTDLDLEGWTPIPGLFAGRNMIQFFANDSAGNIGSEDITIFANIEIDVNQTLQDLTDASGALGIILTEHDDSAALDGTMLVNGTYDMYIDINVSQIITVLINNFDGLAASWSNDFVINTSDQELNDSLLAAGKEPQLILSFDNFEDFLLDDAYTGNLSVNKSLQPFDFIDYCTNDTECDPLDLCSVDPAPCYTSTGDITSVRFDHLSSIVFYDDSIVGNVTWVSPNSTVYTGTNVGMAFTIGEDVYANYTLDEGPVLRLNSGNPARSFSAVLDGTFMNTTFANGILENGPHNITLYLVDLYDNANSTTYPFTVNDTQSPVLVIFPPDDHEMDVDEDNTTDLRINFTSNEYSNVSYKLNCTFPSHNSAGTIASRALSGSVTKNNLKPGSYDLTITAVDMLGHSRIYSYEFDLEEPSCVDNDGDDWGSANILWCEYTSKKDCDDNDDDINPGDTESGTDECSDGEDNDCDGDTDKQDSGCKTTSSSGGGGGGGSSGLPSDKKEQIFSKILADTWEDMTFSSNDMAYTKVEFKPNKELSNVALRVFSYNGAPDGVAPLKNAYQYLFMKTTNFDDDDLTETQITFRVKKSWVPSDHKPEDISLFRMVDDEWVGLDTSQFSSDAYYYHYSAAPPGFSYFCIAGKQDDPPAAAVALKSDGNDSDVGASSNATANSSMNNVSGNAVRDGWHLSWPGFTFKPITWMIVFLVLIVVGILSYFVYEQKMTPKDEKEFKNRDLSSKISIRETTVPPKKLQAYVDFQLARGHTPSKIRDVLVDAGWGKDLVIKAIKQSPDYKVSMPKSYEEVIQKHDQFKKLKK
ncbi:S8 family serine peptidase [Candidatus Woesearchaeota archaeon]|nr:S8 family serine peptidase [Candidatus Woesearchaeota archaeon]